MNSNPRPSFTILDYLVKRTNAIGNCSRTLVEGLGEFDVHLYALDKDPDCRPASFTRIPAIARPLFLLFLSYHLLISARALVRRFKRPVVSIESNTLVGDIVAAQFCHRAFLATQWASSRPTGLRLPAKWFDHWLHALLEPLAFRRAQVIVVPSKGLARELARTYPKETAGKVRVIANPVDVEGFARSPAFDRSAWRDRQAVPKEALLLVFVALGHFERKGLPLVLRALAQVPDLHLLVVGGHGDALRGPRADCAALGISDRVHFLGPQNDVREALWASDLFVLPSSYETFSMVSYEAAAAGLPLLVTPLYGVEDMMQDSVTGWTIERSEVALVMKLREIARGPERLQTMGEKAREAVRGYGRDKYLSRWRALLRENLGESL